MREIRMARAKLHALAAELLEEGQDNRAAIVEDAIALMTRTTVIRRASPRAERMTAEEVREILHRWEASPDATQQEIADACRVNPGRVSEVLHGLRTPEQPNMDHDAARDD